MHPIKAKRSEKKLSQIELSRITGVPQSAISDIENGKTKHPRVDTCQAIAKALGCKVDDLIINIPSP